MSRSIRTLYVARVGFAIVWVGLLSASHPVRTLGAFTDGLLIAYPISDAVATAADLRHDTLPSVRAVQAINLLISLGAALAVAVLAPDSLTGAMNAFALWAIAAGAIQAIVGALRHPHVGGQWPMVLSGAGSVLAGVTFLDWSGTASTALHSLTQYCIGGAIWYALTVFCLFVVPHRSPTLSPRRP